MAHSVVPAIIPQSLAHLESSLDAVRGFAPSVQIDVVDGLFVPPRSWPYGEGEQKGISSDITPLIQGIEVELDLMIDAATEEVSSWLDAGARRIVVHIESIDDIEAVRDTVRAHGALLGVSSNNDTPPDLFLDALRYADYCQCMGIAQIGSQGQPFDSNVLARIDAVRAAYPQMEIAVDGSVNMTTKDVLLTHGVTRLIAGSAIYAAENLESAYRALCE